MLTLGARARGGVGRLARGAAGSVGEAVSAEPAREGVGSAQGSAFELGRVMRLVAGDRLNCRGFRCGRVIAPAPQCSSRDVTVLCEDIALASDSDPVLPRCPASFWVTRRYRALAEPICAGSRSDPVADHGVQM